MHLPVCDWPRSSNNKCFKWKVMKSQLLSTICCGHGTRYKNGNHCKVITLPRLDHLNDLKEVFLSGFKKVQIKFKPLKGSKIKFQLKFYRIINWLLHITLTNSEYIFASWVRQTTKMSICFIGHCSGPQNSFWKVTTLQDE